MGIHLTAPVQTEGAVDCRRANGDRASKPLKRNEQLVYDALRRSSVPLKAYQLLDELQDMGLRAPMTIYRALEALIARDCVKKIESLNAFLAVDCEARTRGHAFLICRNCMKTKEIELDENQLSSLFSPITVTPDDVNIEVFGDCADLNEEHVCCAHLPVSEQSPRDL